MYDCLIKKALAPVYTMHLESSHPYLISDNTARDELAASTPETHMTGVAFSGTATETTIISPGTRSALDMAPELPEATPVSGNRHTAESISGVTIIPGWTLRPTDNWYGVVAEQVEKITKVPVDIAAMPDPDTPDPKAWHDKLEQIATNPDRRLLVGHSLGFITIWNWAARRAAADPDFTIGGLISVSGNKDKVGIDEIGAHFTSDRTFRAQGRLLASRITYRPEFIYGAYDPFYRPTTPLQHRNS